MALLTLLLTISLFSLAQSEFAVVGDAGENNSNSQMVMKSLLKDNTQHLIMPGDNLYSSSYEAIWKPWLDSKFDFSVVALGNHNGGYQKEITFFKMPGEFYKKDFGSATFFVLNSDNAANIQEQMSWLKENLEKTKTSFVFLVYHHPTYTISSFHKGSEKEEFQSSLKKLFKKYRNKLTAVIVGHDHIASLVHFGDLPVIVSGAVQDIREDKPVDYTQDNMHIKTAWYFKKGPHWVKLKINSLNVSADYIDAATNTIQCSATLKTGSPAQLSKNCLSKN